MNDYSTTYTNKNEVVLHSHVWCPSSKPINRLLRYEGWPAPLFYVPVEHGESSSDIQVQDKKLSTLTAF